MTVTSVAPGAVQSFATDDPEVAQQLLIDSYGDHRMRFVADPTSFHLALRRRDVGAFQIDDFELHGEAAFDFAGGDQVLISRIRRGRARLGRRNGDDVEVGAGDVAVTGAPGLSRGSEADDVHAQVLTLKCEALAAAAARYSGLDPTPIELFDLRPISFAHARVWAQTLTAVSKLFEDADVAGARLIAGRTGRLLAAVTLSTFPHAALDGLFDPGTRDARPATLSRAIAFIEAEPDADIAVADIARAAQVTPRTVQHAFRRHLETTPMAYLRRIRLDHTHQQLREAAPGDGATVAQIALDWGFPNPSRFARYYRATYGRPPSETLGE
jgi:AraC-like DNA-binding protein